MAEGEVIGLVVSILFLLAAFFGTEIFLPVDPESTPLQKKTRHFWALVLGLSFFLMSGVCSFMVLTRMEYEGLKTAFNDRFEDLRSMTAPPPLDPDSTPDHVARSLFWALQYLLTEDPPEIGTDRLREELEALVESFAKGYLPLRETDLLYFLTEAYMTEGTYKLPYIVATNSTGLDEFFPASEQSNGGQDRSASYSYLHEQALKRGIPVIRLFLFNGTGAYCDGVTPEECWTEYVEAVEDRVREDYPTLVSVTIDVDTCGPVIERILNDEVSPIDFLLFRDWSRDPKDQLVLVDRLIKDTWERKEKFFMSWSSSVLAKASEDISEIWNSCEEREVDPMDAAMVQDRFGGFFKEMDVEEGSNEPLALQLASKLVTGKE